MLRFYGALMVFVLFSHASSSVSSAQELPLLLQLPSQVAGPSTYPARHEAGPRLPAPGNTTNALSHDQSLQLAAPDPELWRVQHRARLLLGIGAGLLTSAAITAAWIAPVGDCRPYGRVKRTGYAAGIIGAAGLSMMITGAVRRAQGSQQGPYAATAKERRRVWAGAIGVMLLSVVGLTSLGMFEIITECSV